MTAGSLAVKSLASIPLILIPFPASHPFAYALMIVRAPKAVWLAHGSAINIASGKPDGTPGKHDPGIPGERPKFK